jgi:hypothetical protein
MKVVQKARLGREVFFRVDSEGLNWLGVNSGGLKRKSRLRNWLQPRNRFGVIAESLGKPNESVRMKAKH